MRQTHTLCIEALEAGYGGERILKGIDLAFPSGKITAIIGPNGCGKSTCLRTMARLLRPSQGKVLLDGRAIHEIPTKALARQMGLLPQSPLAPEGITVSDLVGRGRTPHHGPLARWSRDDDRAVARALTLAGLADLAGRDVDALSGGQRQRCWIAMALAQETDLLLLDEPTTYLDIVHQLDVLDLLTDLNRTEGVTVIMVLHDLNMAARYADHVIAMTDGRVCAEGPPASVFTVGNMKRIFGLTARIVPDPVYETPMIVPIGRRECDAPSASA